MRSRVLAVYLERLSVAELSPGRLTHSTGCSFASWFQREEGLSPVDSTHHKQTPSSHGPETPSIVLVVPPQRARNVGLPVVRVLWQEWNASL